MNKAAKHLADNWFKYILEVLVIIVGVLGAFGLNHWNEARLRLRTEQDVLKQIAFDLQRTVNSVQACSDSHLRIIATAQKAIDHMEGSEPYTDEVAYWLAGAFFYTQLDNDLGGYKTMLSHGVDIVSNRELRNQIIYHFEKRLATTKRRERILFDFADKVKLYESQKYFNYTFGVENFFVDGEAAKTWSGVRLKSEPRNYELLRNSAEYRYHLRTYMETVKWYELSIQEIGAQTATLIEAIDAEVASLAT